MIRWHKSLSIAVWGWGHCPICLGRVNKSNSQSLNHTFSLQLTVTANAMDRQLLKRTFPTHNVIPASLDLRFIDEGFRTDHEAGLGNLGCDNPWIPTFGWNSVQKLKDPVRQSTDPVNPLFRWFLPLWVGHSNSEAAERGRARCQDMPSCQGQYGFMLDYADENLRADPEIVKATVRQTGIALQFAAEETEAFWTNSLRHCSSNSRRALARGHAQRSRNRPGSSEAPCFGAVFVASFSWRRQNGLALEFASSALRQNREVVLVAVCQDSCTTGWCDGGDTFYWIPFAWLEYRCWVPIEAPFRAWNTSNYFQWDGHLGVATCPFKNKTINTFFRRFSPNVLKALQTSSSCFLQERKQSLGVFAGRVPSIIPSSSCGVWIALLASGNATSNRHREAQVKWNAGHLIEEHHINHQTTTSQAVQQRNWSNCCNSTADKSYIKPKPIGFEASYRSESKQKQCISTEDDWAKWEHQIEGAQLCQLSSGRAQIWSISSFALPIRFSQDGSALPLAAEELRADREAEKLLVEVVTVSFDFPSGDFWHFSHMRLFVLYPPVRDVLRSGGPGGREEERCDAGASTRKIGRKLQNWFIDRNYT